MNKEPKIGDRVQATMNGEDWYTGVLVELSDVMVRYGVKRDDTGEVRFFVNAIPDIRTTKRKTK